MVTSLELDSGAVVGYDLLDDEVISEASTTPPPEEDHDDASGSVSVSLFSFSSICMEVMRILILTMRFSLSHKCTGGKNYRRIQLGKSETFYQNPLFSLE